jgi:hypothetical protein
VAYLEVAHQTAAGGGRHLGTGSRVEFELERFEVRLKDGEREVK